MRAMFEPRPPVEFARLPTKPPPQPYSGINQYVGLFETAPPPPREKYISYAERKTAERAALMKVHAEKVELEKEDWDPKKDKKATEDPYRTLMVARLSYDTTEKKLRREFEQYGPIESLRVVMDGEGKPRGYAFIEFEKEGDMKNAYKRADGKKIDGRRILVDVERGRTVKGWVPRRLGGGLGGTRKGPGEENTGRGAGGSAREEMSRGGGGGSGRGRSRSPERRVERERSRDRGDRGDRGDRDRGDRDRGDRGRRSRSRSPPRGRRDDRDRDRGGDHKRRRSRSSDNRYGPASGGDSSRYGPSGGDKRRR